MLSVRNLSAFYGDFQALFDLDLDVNAGETVALIGANGAGKTTLVGALCGLVSLKADTLAIKNETLIGKPADVVARHGIAMSPEGRRVFASLTVKENLLMGANVGRSGRWTLDAVLELFPEIHPLLKRRADALSGGQQQMVVIGRALMANPALLLLDEVSLGLAPIVIDKLYKALETLRSKESSVLLIEQDVGRALSASDRFYCLLEGRISLSGDSQTADRSAVSHAYFGD